MRLPLAAVLLSLAALLPTRARAETPPACAEGSAGLVAGKLCACRFERGGAVSGLPAGYRWDCGVLRPACGDAAFPPATLDPYPYPLPPGLSLDLGRGGARR